MDICICILNQFAGYLKLIQHCKSTLSLLSPGRVRHFATPCTAARQTSLSPIISKKSTYSYIKLKKKITSRDFPGGPMARTSPSRAGGEGLIPDCGAKISHAATAKSLQSCPTLCDPIEGSPTGSPVPGILQARTLQWVAISFSNA